MKLDGLTFLTALCSQMDVFRLVVGKGQRKFHFPRSDALPLSHRDSIIVKEPDPAKTGFVQPTRPKRFDS